MLAVERRNQILEKIQDEKRVIVSDLSQIYEVSEETIRRDLDKLHKDGLVIKSYGGAVINEESNIDMPFNVRKKSNVPGKLKIGGLVEKMVNDGDHIILDASTTAVFIAKALKKKERLTILTNSIEILIELSDMPGWNVISTGGNLKEGYLALVGSKVYEDLSGYNAEKLFFSCKGLHMNRGITDSIEPFSQVKQGMMNSAARKILTVDHTKFGKVAFSKICDLSKVDIVVTDKKPDAEWIAWFEQSGVEYIYQDI